MKIIELTQGKQVVVDDEDYEFLSQWQWYANRSGGGLWYAARSVDGKVLLMHHALLGIDKGSGLVADHKNHNTLDNRRSNIRICTRTQNQQNRHGWMRKGAFRSSRFKGVSWVLRKNRKTPYCQARIYINGQRIKKDFRDEEAAARWYDEMARKHFGEFALTNFAEAA